MTEATNQQTVEMLVARLREIRSTVEHAIAFYEETKQRHDIRGNFEMTMRPGLVETEQENLVKEAEAYLMEFQRSAKEAPYLRQIVGRYQRRARKAGMSSNQLISALEAKGLARKVYAAGKATRLESTTMTAGLKYTMLVRKPETAWLAEELKRLEAEMGDHASAIRELIMRYELGAYAGGM